MSDEPTYNQATGFTAGELRELGADIEAAVPDVAWVRKNSVQFTPGPVSYDPKTGRISTRFALRLHEPWRWIHLTIEQEL